MKPIQKHKKSLYTQLGAVVLSIGMVTYASASSAEGTTTCASREKVVKALSEVYEEAPVSIGLTEEGAVLEVMASHEGSFTIVVTHPNGLTCPVAAGTAWQSITAKLKGEGA